MIRQHHLIRGTIALAAVLTASLAPAARADPAPLANAETTIAANTQSNTTARPNPDQQTATDATANPGPCSEVCSGAAGSYGSTNAIPPALRPARSSEQAANTRAEAREAHALAYSSPANARYSSAATNGYSTASTLPTLLRLATNNGGFHWGDAGIGAGGMLALTLIGFGGAVTLTHRRRIHDQHAS